MNTIKISFLSITLALALIGCASRDEGTPTGGPVCGNMTCENGESTQSCPDDCTTTVVCDNDGTCDAGEDNANCPADCGTDELPPDGSESWVCRASYRGGKAYWACNPDYIANSPATVDFVGVCPALGLSGYYGANGHHITASLNDNGEYEVEVPASAASGVSCEMTYAYKNSSGTVIWAQYGTNSVTDTVAGAYRECGTRSGVYACGMFFKTVTGHMPAPLGFYPN